jgi:hypothetical protein
MSHRRPVSFVILFSMVALGCSAAHAPEEEIVSGVYALRIRAESDHCSPRRPTGDVGDVAVLAFGDRLSVPVPEGGGDRTADVTGRVTLAEEAGFHLELSAGMDECATARTDRTFTVTERAADAFAVEYAQRFEGLAGCGPMEDAPAADCLAVRTFDFRLESACESPCELAWSADVGVACDCP